MESNSRLRDGLGESFASLSRGVVKVMMKLLTSNLGFTGFSLVPQRSLVEGHFRLSEHHRKSHGVVKQCGNFGNPDALFLKGTEDSMNFRNFRLNEQTGFFIGRLQSASMFGESLRETCRAQYLLN